MSYAQAQHAVLYHKRQELVIRTRFNHISRSGVNFEFIHTYFSGTVCFQEMRMFYHECTRLPWRYRTRHIVCTSNIQSATESLSAALLNSRRNQKFPIDVLVYKHALSLYMMVGISAHLSHM